MGVTGDREGEAPLTSVFANSKGSSPFLCWKAHARCMAGGHEKPLRSSIKLSMLIFISNKRPVGLNLSMFNCSSSMTPKIKLYKNRKWTLDLHEAFGFLSITHETTKQAKWICYEDHWIRFFYAKIGLRKHAYFIYLINDSVGNGVVKVIIDYYKGLLGKHAKEGELVDTDIRNNGLDKVYSKGVLIHILGVPIIASKLSKIECRGLLEKITSYLAYHDFIQELPMGANSRIGLKNLEAWSNACDAKLVWDIALKKGNLWIKCIHFKYLRSMD
ncbi:LOW QUALITY PROTEIN: hypothetical protein Cgig2_025785 [Carnegiea gigantea]|uniref:Uncharacterized protein n=1 Tax=Carnegiea gigantea TaxID=171969 RepID=A0A9Q1JQS0_9CARY|nr:LOW QUALITY PROTEIN: hypothetical protein Cgig2_025785 [Carnegiea gigantea]